MQLKAIIAAGGSGTRLRPLTFSSNKHVLPIANKPLILYPFEAIVKTGVKEIGVIVNETRPAIEALLGDGSDWGVSVTYITQEKALGLAHVVKISQDFLGDTPFVYHLGDNIFSEGIQRTVDHFMRTKPDALLTMVEHEENYRLGVPFFDKDGNLEKVVEKPENPPNKFGVPGLYFFNKNVFKAFEGEDAIKPSARGELEITDLYTYLLQHGYKVEAEELDGRWMDPGKFDDMLESNRYLLNMKQDVAQDGSVDKKTTMHGIVEIGKGSTVDACQIHGPVSIGKNVVMKNCTIGPNVSIDEACTLENVAVKNSIVMKQTEIKNVNHQIVDSLIGKNTKIWKEKQESVSLFIGDDCKVRLT